MKYDLILLMLTLTLFTCVERPRHDMDNSDVSGLSAICIMDNSPLREEPVLEGELITTLFLGDEFVFTGEIETDMFTEYYKIELYDGTAGWLEKEAVLFHAKHAAVIKQTSLYPEIDSHDKSQVTIYPAEYVAILKEEGDWVKVISADRKKGGWMHRENVSTSEEDIFIATLAHADLLNEEGVIKTGRLPAFIHSLPDKNTALAVYLQERLEEEVVDAIASSIFEYETAEENEN
jgi:hypothetical protein